MAAKRLSYYETTKHTTSKGTYELIACGRRHPHCMNIMQSDGTTETFGSYGDAIKSFGEDQSGTVGGGPVATLSAKPKPGPLGESASMNADANAALATALKPHLEYLQTAMGSEELKLMAAVDNEGIHIVPGLSGSGTKVFVRRGLIHRWLRHWFMPWAHD